VSEPLIRPAAPADCSTLVELVSELAAYEGAADQVELSPERLQDVLFSPEPRVFAHIAEADGAVVGFALWFFNFSTWLGRHGIYVEDLYVRPEARRHGVARALFAELARIAVERDCGRIEWWVLDWNEAAISFYRALGAAAMDEWTVFRLTGDALTSLARARSGPRRRTR
jgi:GNAT superfamily N-acetyltransferase